MKSGYVAALAMAVAAAAASGAEAQQRASGHPPRATAQETQVSPEQSAIERAMASGRYALVFFWKDRSQQTDKTWSSLQATAGKYAEQAEVVAIQVSDPAELAAVTHYGVDRAPTPLVLSIAPCGAITKAITGLVDETQLRAAFVSPCTQLCLKALQDRKLVFVCVVNSDPALTLGTLPHGVEEFCADGRYAGATEVVMLNASDRGEAAFLQQLEVDQRVAKPVTVLVAPPGSVIGKFNSNATKEHLISSITSAHSNPCAGGKCGPNGCGPKR